jgi:alkanesulfonate monooxygenase SsuD/methylene tetrahydromethanopterin reductase-like flavin-dependent oxidoreductase (luciferase family)
MEFGVGYFPTHDGIGPGEVARKVEERGQNAIFFAEHTHIPASRETPYSGGPVLPRKYWHCYDLFVALTAAATATTHLRVGSGVCLVIERDPITTANEVASVDHLSGGRLEFGVGAGWNREEMANHGTDPRTGIAELRARADRLIQVQVLSVPPDPKVLEQLEGAGVHRVARWLPSGPWSVVEPGLETWEQAIAALTGR